MTSKAREIIPFFSKYVKLNLKTEIKPEIMSTLKVREEMLNEIEIYRHSERAQNSY